MLHHAPGSATQTAAPAVAQLLLRQALQDPEDMVALLIQEAQQQPLEVRITNDFADPVIDHRI